MTKHTVPADEGLPKPNSAGSVLTETEWGLSVCRPLKSLRTSILPAESLDAFLSLLDRYVEAGDREDYFRHYWSKVGIARPMDETDKKFRSLIGDAQDTQKAARRALIRHLNQVRGAPAKTLDDILFKGRDLRHA